VKFIGHGNGTAPRGADAAAWALQTMGSVDNPIVDERALFSLFGPLQRYNLNHKGGSMAKDKSPKKEVKKPKKKK
jgi:hypothetical protein